MAEGSDNDLYARWANGEASAGEKLVGQYVARIGRFFANKVADVSATEDLTSKTFLECSRKLGSFRGESSFRSYLFGIARNVLRDYVKAKGRAPDVDFEVTCIADIGPSQSVVLAERKEEALVLEAMRALPLNYQIVLELSFFEEMTQAEIADTLAIPPGTVATRLRRGKQQLSDKLAVLADSPELLESTESTLADWARSIRKLLGEDPEPN